MYLLSPISKTEFALITTLLCTPFCRRLIYIAFASFSVARFSLFDTNPALIQVSQTLIPPVMPRSHVSVTQLHKSSFASLGFFFVVVFFCLVYLLRRLQDYRRCTPLRPCFSQTLSSLPPIFLVSSLPIQPFSNSFKFSLVTCCLCYSFYFSPLVLWAGVFSVPNLKDDCEKALYPA